MLAEFLDIILHLDTHLSAIITEYGMLTYALLFLIIFCETGLVIAPFLPGDSLLFAVGAIAAQGPLDITAVFLLLVVAAILGDALNYWIGRHAGSRIFTAESRFVKKEYLEHTKAFYAKHGKKTIVLARFLPIIRTFAPFVAGIGRMDYPSFFAYNIIGGILWCAAFIGGGYFFGNITFVKENFTLVILGIIILSLLMVVIEYARHRRGTAGKV